jgi:hypothetical protein
MCNGDDDDVNSTANDRAQQGGETVTELWRPRFLMSNISANDRVKRVDSSQSLVNLGHHLQNFVNNH